jgi:hypothetical protein
MILPLRPALGVLAVVTLSLAISPFESYYTRAALAGATAALVLSLAACLSPDHRYRLPAFVAPCLLVGALLAVLVWCGLQPGNPKKDWSVRLLRLAAVCLGLGMLAGTWRPREFLATAVGAAALLLAGFGILLDKPLLYGEIPEAVRSLRWAGIVGFVGLGALILGHGFRWLGLSLVFVAGCWLRVGAIWASPEPVIDVFSWLRDAPAELLQGHNPYSASYQSPYGTERASHYLLTNPPDSSPAVYPPLPILGALPFRAAGVDVRCLNVLADLTAALALVLAGRARGASLVGRLAAGLYLLVPRASYVIEQGWYEPVLAATLGLGAVFAERGCRLGHWLLAVGVTGKQFGVVLLLPLLRGLGSEWRRLVVALGGVVALVILPFVLWQPHDFFTVVLMKHIERPASLTSVTLQSGAHDVLGINLPQPVLWAGAGILLGLVAWRTPRLGTGAFLWAGTALTIFCLFHTHGNFNYFYLCQYLWLLGIVGLAPRMAASQAVAAPAA